MSSMSREGNNGGDLFGALGSLIIILMFAFLCAGSFYEDKKIAETQKQEVIEKKRTEGGKYVHKDAYDGHAYIFFYSGQNGYGVHDPDCKCNTKDKN